MARAPQLLDQYGRPVNRSVLTQEVAGPTLAGVRSPLSGYAGDGLDPISLAAILRAADMGDPVRYLELAETIEERDPHYLGVLSTRKRSVSQIDITVEAASVSPRDVEIADMIRDWVERDELTDEIVDVLDCIGKGYSFTEILWDTSEGQWQPGRLEWRDPRWFRFDRADLATPRLIEAGGQEVPLEPFKFIHAKIKAKSGLALRAGLARVAAWGWMFKAYTQRDWAIFSQTYGQPLRLGKYGPTASAQDQDTLFRAVANIAGDCAAIIPVDMSIDFIEAGNVGAASGLYKERAEFLDMQISKAVLGQTATTDAVTGGLGSGKEHRQVQEDIERSDAKALAAILNRDLVRPWVQLEYGPQRAYPKIVIGRPEEEDLKLAAEILGVMVPLGMRVSMAEARDRFGWADPAKEEEVLGVIPAGTAPPAPPAVQDPGAMGPESKVKGGLKGGVADFGGGRLSLQAEGPPAAVFEGTAVVDVLGDRLADDGRPGMRRMLDRIEAMLEAATDLDQFREMLLNGFEDIDDSLLAETLAQAMTAAHLAGQVEVIEEDEVGADG